MKIGYGNRRSVTVDNCRQALMDLAQGTLRLEEVKKTLSTSMVSHSRDQIQEALTFFDHAQEVLTCELGGGSDA